MGGSGEQTSMDESKYPTLRRTQQSVNLEYSHLRRPNQIVSHLELCQLSRFVNVMFLEHVGKCVSQSRHPFSEALEDVVLLLLHRGSTTDNTAAGRKGRGAARHRRRKRQRGGWRSRRRLQPQQLIPLEVQVDALW